jgi:hypothetical protein
MAHQRDLGEGETIVGTDQRIGLGYGGADGGGGFYSAMASPAFASLPQQPKKRGPAASSRPLFLGSVSSVLR